MLKKLFLLLVGLALTSTALAERRADHVFIVSFDGGKPAVIHESEMPVIKKLAAEGASTWTAQTIFPSITLPSHTSMLTGVGPEKHQVNWNNFSPLRGKVKVPTIFTLAKQHDPKLGTALFAGKVKFRHLWQTDSLDIFDYDGPQEDAPIAASPSIEAHIIPALTVAKDAAAYIVEKKPNLCFIHFADPDHIGHKVGWGTPEQKEAFKSSDQALGQVVASLEQAGITDSSVILITADHGGHDRTHGTNTPDDMNIPWIAWGKGVKKNYTLTQPITTYDTAATALWLLDVPLPDTFDGKPVTEAFK